MTGVLGPAMASVQSLVMTGSTIGTLSCGGVLGGAIAK